jgi:hypothetical protein
MKTDIEKLLAEASDTTTSADRLKELWYQTKSSRVRRAISSNPNLDKGMIQIASRLYIKEVVNNQSIELMQLFIEDVFLKRLYDAYNNPDKFFYYKRVSSFENIPRADRPCIARALLISPNLTNKDTLVSCFTQLSITEFKRELDMNPECFDRIKGMFKGGLDLPSACLSVLLDLNKIGVVTGDDFIKSLRFKMRGYSSLLPKGQYRNTFNYFFDKSLSGSKQDYQNLISFLLTCRPENVNDLLKIKDKVKIYLSDQSLKLLSKLYLDVLKLEVVKCRVFNMGKAWSLNQDTPYGYVLSDLVWDIISLRNNVTKDADVDSLDLQGLANDIKLIGFDENSGLYTQQNNLLERYYGNISSLLSLSRKLLDLDDKSFIYMATSGILSRTWFCRNSPGSSYAEVVDRINDLNSEAFAKNYGVLYKRSELGVSPTFFISKLHKSCAKSREYSKSPSDPLPPGSSFMDDSFICETLKIIMGTDSKYIQKVLGIKA